MINKKTIVIDASSLIGLVDGLSQYIANILKFIPDESFDEFNFRLLINKHHKRPDLNDVLNTGRFEVQEGVIPLIGPKRDFWFYQYLKKYEKSFDLIHITSTQYPLVLKKKGIGTVHDLTVLFHYFKKNILYNAAPVYFRQVVRSCLKNAEAVIAVSQATKNELIKLNGKTKSGADNIAVIYEGWEHQEQYKTTAVQPD
ncbi:MAG: glycosyltransferase, partial [Chitinophagaceae bacterium]